MVTATRSNVTAQRALHDVQARLKAVLDTAVDAIITIDGQGIMQSVNPATERLFGYRASELVKRNVRLLMPEPYRGEHDSYLKRYLRTGAKHIIGIGREVQARRKDGSVFPVDLAVSEVEPGKLFTGIIRDISERKLAEARARETDRMASIGTLAAGLGHDMNNVLLPVRAHLNALKSGAGCAVDRSSHVDRIEKGVKYLQQLADGLHYLAMDPEQDDDAQGLTDLHRWWSQTGALLSKAVPKHVDVSVAIPQDLPEVAVAGHALTQAMLNLIVNAGEAIPKNMERGRGSVHVWAKPDEAAQRVHLGVSDNGIGMSEDVQRRAFDMFFTTKPRGMGTGLGLALVRRIVDRAGGTIQLHTQLNRGTTFTLLLPASKHAASANAEHTAAAITIADGRAATMVANLAEFAGFSCSRVRAPGREDVWIVSPAAGMLRSAQSWRKRRPGGALVLFGRPVRDVKAWRVLRPIVIEDIDRIDVIERALASAVELLHGKDRHGESTHKNVEPDADR